MRLLILSVVALCLCAGCAPVFSAQTLRLVDRGVTFAGLRRAPERYAGRTVLVGGTIAAVRNTKEGGELEVVEHPTDEEGEITDTATSGGRFLARSTSFLDPLVYRRGFLVTLVGEVRGEESRPLDAVDYTYPVLTIRALHLWQPEEVPGPPRFHFGIGVGTIIR